VTQAPTILDLGAGVYDLIGNAHRNEIGGGRCRTLHWPALGGNRPGGRAIADLRGGGMVYVGIDSDIALGPVVITR
jgi:hypothetical protein